MSKPLAGIRVIELANFIAGPLCGTLLADMGADVVKVEPPGGDMSRATPPIRNGESVSFTALNRNKRSLVLDLKLPDAQAVMRKLAAKSDVFVEANRPGALEKMGLGADQLKAVNPKLIYTSVSGFGQTGPRVGSFDGGFGAALLASQVGQKKAKEIWFLCRQYDAQEALDMGLVNTVVPVDELEATTVQWCREMLENSPIALRCLKAALNADCDGQAGLQELAGNATLLFYLTEEGQEGRNAFVEKRKPNFKKFKRFP